MHLYNGKAQYRICYLYDNDSGSIFSWKTRCLANCRLLRVSVHCCLVFVLSVQEASACACSYKYQLNCCSQRSPTSSFFHSTARDTPCVSRWNCFHWPPIMNRHTTIIIFCIHMYMCVYECTVLAVLSDIIHCICLGHPGLLTMIMQCQFMFTENN